MVLPEKIVRLFTSNSHGNWAKIWISALTVCLIVVAAAELLLRYFSYTPTVVDDAKLWSLHRERAGNHSKEIVLLGSSRMLTDVSVQVLQSQFPGYNVINLAIDGSCPNEVLHDLALDNSFNGTVLVDFREECLFFGHEAELSGNDIIHYYHNSFTLNEKLNRIIATFFQKHLIIIDPYMNVFKLGGSLLLQKQMRKPRYWTTTVDRTQLLDSDKRKAFKSLRGETKNEQVEQNDEKFAFKSENPEYHTNFDRLKDAIAAINKRGGKVIFIRFPINDEGWRHDEKYFPRSRYWDPLEKSLGVTLLHSLDYPDLSRFDCPDGSHIDYRDKKALTTELSTVLKKHYGMGD